MNETTQLPENDPDLLLAREYGKTAGLEETDNELSDPLIRLLTVAQRESAHLEHSVATEGKERVWGQISASCRINNDRKSSNIFYPDFSGRIAWAAAAIALIIFASFLLIRQASDTQPQLIAQSGASIEYVDLPDGSSITLRPNSQLFRKSADERVEHYQITGEALFDIYSSADRLFMVDAGSGRVTVTGTRFNVMQRGRETSVHLFEGDISFGLIGRDQIINLTPGEAARVDQNMQLSKFTEFEESDIIAWTQDRINFRNRTAESIFEEIEHHFNIQITAPDQINSQRLGGSVDLTSQEETLRDLGRVLGGDFILTSQNHFQFRPE